jgi:hypothetical protein
MCQKCQIYLNDYFQQPIDKENPLYSFINQKRLQERVPEITSLILRLLFSVLNPFILHHSKSELENYCSFICKFENPYQGYELLYRFLKQNKQVAKEITFYEDSILDLNFLKMKRQDKNGLIAQQWLSHLIGSLFEDMYQLHNDHSGKTPLEYINLGSGPPGRPFKNHFKKNDNKDTVCVVGDDDLYT